MIAAIVGSFTAFSAAFMILIYAEVKLLSK